jgi:hypothetical protein
MSEEPGYARWPNVAGEPSLSASDNDDRYMRPQIATEYRALNCHCGDAPDPHIHRPVGAPHIHPVSDGE